MLKMHGAVIKYIAFDERVFRNGPVLLDDGVYSHMLIPDDVEFLPSLNGEKDGDYTLFVSASGGGESGCLEFSLYSSDYTIAKKQAVPLSALYVNAACLAAGGESEEIKSRICSSVVGQVVQGWLAEPDPYFEETLATFLRAAVEDTYGDIMTGMSAEPGTSMRSEMSMTRH